MKRKYTTAQVVAMLSRHHNWTAKAPCTDDFYPCKALTDGVHIGFITHFPPSDDANGDGNPPIRDDWEIVKPKRKRVVVGKTSFSDVFNDWDFDLHTNSLDKSKTYKLVAVEE